MTVTDASDSRRELLATSALVEFTVAVDLDDSSFTDADDFFETVSREPSCLRLHIGPFTNCTARVRYPIPRKLMS